MATNLCGIYRYNYVIECPLVPTQYCPFRSKGVYVHPCMMGRINSLIFVGQKILRTSEITKVNQYHKLYIHCCRLLDSLRLSFCCKGIDSKKTYHPPRTEHNERLKTINLPHFSSVRDTDLLPSWTRPRNGLALQ